MYTHHIPKMYVWDLGFNVQKLKMGVNVAWSPAKYLNIQNVNKTILKGMSEEEARKGE